jgi:hypothetical protein
MSRFILRLSGVAVGVALIVAAAAILQAQWYSIYVGLLGVMLATWGGLAPGGLFREQLLRGGGQQRFTRLLRERRSNRTLTRVLLIATVGAVCAAVAISSLAPRGPLELRIVASLLALSGCTLLVQFLFNVVPQLLHLISRLMTWDK